MNLVFVNSFEKRAEGGRTLTARVSIAEQHGVWYVMWDEPGQDGHPAEQANWYEGSQWHDMLEVFRVKLAEKAAAGFLPLISGPSDEESGIGKPGLARMLHYFSDMHANEELFKELRQWRKEQASKENKPAYIIATNRVLRMIACFIPKTPEELKHIPGFGDHKNTLYGKAIIELTSKYESAYSFPLDWVPGRIDDYQFRVWIHQQREARMKTELERKAARKQLLELASRGESLTDIVKTMQRPRRELVLWVEELETEGYDLGEWIDRELHAVPENERDAAKQAMLELGDRYLKPVLKKVYSEEDLKSKDLERAYEWLRLFRLRHRREHAAGPKAG